MTLLDDKITQLKAEVVLAKAAVAGATTVPPTSPSELVDALQGVMTFTQAGAGAQPQKLDSILRETVSITQFMTDEQRLDSSSRTGSQDLSGVLQKARDHLASRGANPPALVFPAGVYSYSLSPNWAGQGFKLEAHGNVTFRYTGTGNAVEVNTATAGGSPDIYNVAIGTPANKIIIEAPATAGHGLFVKGAHHSQFCVDVRGCGAASAGVWVEFAVCSEFWPVVSKNTTGAWYEGAKPKYGIYTNRRSPAEPVSYCTFHMPIAEWCEIGIMEKYSNGNLWIGGTAEGCDKQGIYLDALATSAKFIGTGVEANSQLGAGLYPDVTVAGTYNTFDDLDTMDAFRFAACAVGNTLRGGIHQSIILDAGADSNLVTGASYKRGLGTGSLIDNGANNRIEQTMDMQTRKVYRKILPLESVIVGASPFTYTNTHDYNVAAVVVGGVGNSLTIIRAPDTGVPLSVTNGAIPLCPGDSLKISYSTAPFLVLYPQQGSV